MMMKKNLYVAVAVSAFIGLAFSTAFLLARLDPVDITSQAVAARAPETVGTAPMSEWKQSHNISDSQRQDTDSPQLVDPVNSSGFFDQQSVPALNNSRPAFNAEAIFDATQKIRLDDHGSVVLDHDTLVLLQHALGQRDLQLDELALAELKDLVEYAVPGSAGAQAAVMVGNYYEFLRAKAAYEEAAQADDYDDRQRHIQLLRETYLGAEVAEKLFAQTDAENAWMRANMMLSANTSLTEEERQQQQLALQQEYIDRVLSANGWTQRYQQFVRQKAALAGTSASGDAQEQAISDLWHTHFSAEEREKMMALQVPVF